MPKKGKMSNEMKYFLWMTLTSCFSTSEASFLRGFALSTTTHSLSVSWPVQTSSSTFTVEIHGSRTVVCDSTSPGPCLATGLTPGSGYLIKVINNTDDSVYQNTYYTVPRAPDKVLLKKSDASPTTSLSVTWTVPLDNDNNVRYKVRLDRVSSISVTGTDMETTNPYTYTGLVPGAGYQAFVWAEAGDISKTGQRSTTTDSGSQVYTIPEGPVDVSLRRNPGYETSELILNWRDPSIPTNDEAVIYKARLGDGQDMAVHNGEKIFTGLLPATSYTVILWAQVTDIVKSVMQRVSQYTAPNKPSVPSVSAIDTKTIQVRWITLNGLVYDVTIYKDHMTHTKKTACESVSMTMCLIDVHTLYSASELAGQKYWISLQAKVSADRSVKSEQTDVQAVNTVPKSPTGILLKKSDASPTTSLSVTWTVPLDNDNNVRYKVRLDRVSSISVTGTDMETTNPYTFSGLVPGAGYKVFVWAEAGDLSSNGQRSIMADSGTQSVYTDPESPADVTLIRNPGHETNQLKLTWTTPSNPSNDDAVTYKAKLANYLVETVDNELKVFTGLSPATFYNVTVWAQVTDTVRSDEQTASQFTAPTKPAIQTVSALNTRTIEVRWTALTGIVYDVAIYKDGMTQTKRTACGSVPLSPCDIDVQTLYSSSEVPGQKYWISLQAKISADPSVKSDSTQAQAVNTKPLPPEVLYVESRTTTTLVIRWNLTSQTYSDRFIYSVTPMNNVSPTLQSTDRKLTLANLKPGRSYTVSIKTVAGSSGSDQKTLTFYTQPTAPNKPARDLTKTTTTTLAVVWSVPPDSGQYEKFIASIPALNKQVEKNKNDMSAVFNDLTPGTAYRVQVVSVVGNDVQSDSRSTDKLFTKPSKPVSVSATEQTSSGLRITWKAPEGGVARYQIILNGNNPVDNGLLTEKSFSGLTSGTLFTVTLYSETEDGTQSDQVVKQYYTAPDPPTNVQEDKAVRSTNRVGVTWSAPKIGDYDGFRVTITGLGAPLTRILSKDDTSETFDNVLPGDVYIIILKSTLRSLYSTKVSQLVTANPNPPRSLRLRPGSNSTDSVTFSWTSPDQSASVDRYDYTVQRKGTADKVGGQTPAMEALVTHLVPGATYTIAVKAIKSDAGSESTVLEGVTLMPERPSNLREIVTDKATTLVHVVWDGPVIGVHTGYRVEWYKGQKLAGGANVTSTSKFISDLKPGQRYTVIVYTVSNGVRSVGINGTFNTSIEAVELTLSGKNPTNITIRWRDPAATEVSHYTVYIRPKSGKPGTEYRIEPSSLKTYGYTFTGLVPGETYITTVVVYSTGGLSNAANRTDTTYPLSVLAFNAWTMDTHSINLSWIVDAASKRDGFKISSIGERDMFIPSSDVQLDYEMKVYNLSPGLTYTFSLQTYSKDSNGQEVYSVGVKEATETTRPLPVINYVATRSAINATSVELRWMSDPESQQDGYVIVFRGQFVKKANKTLTVSDYQKVTVVSGLFPGELYTFFVKAKSSDKYSDPVSQSLAIYPLPPTNVSVSPNRGSETTSVPIVWMYDAQMSYIQDWNITYLSLYTENQFTRTILAAEGNRTFNLTGLTPGEHYIIHVYGVTVGYLHSIESTDLIVTAKPTIGASKLSESSTTSTSVTATYTAPGVNGVFDKYVFSIGDDVKRIEKARDDPDQLVRFTHLVPGTLYTLHMWLQSGNEVSLPTYLDVLTNPLAPTVRCGLLTSRSFELIITSSQVGQVDSYHVTCLQCKLSMLVTRRTSASTTKHTVTGLRPYTEYKYEVNSVRQVSSGLVKESHVITGVCKTKIGPPGPVQLFKVTHTKPYQVTLLWGPPTANNGIIRGFTVEYSGTKPNKPPVTTKIEIIDDPHARTTNITDLKAGFRYTFHIFARNGLNGIKTNLSITLPIDPPELDPDRNVEPGVVSSGGEKGIEWNKVTLNFTNPFTDRNGDVVNYSIIVASADRRNPELEGDIDQSWYAVHKSTLWPPYAAIYKCQNLFTSDVSCPDQIDSDVYLESNVTSVDYRQIVIGGDESCDSDKMAADGYCNGPLQPNTRYKVFLRGYNEEDEFGDSAAVIVLTAKKPLQVAVIVPVLLLFIVAITLVVVILMWRYGFLLKKDRNKKSEPVKLAMGLRKSEASRPVKIVEFAEHFKQMSDDSDFKFSEEYESLKSVGRNQSCEVAQLAYNRAKNRYVNILPYDHSRVKLLSSDDEEGATDYINASWIPGYNSKREFIACQGPLPATRDDHWRMVWECNCRAIVMLANCVESGRDKCDHYWPYDREPRRYGDIQVQIVEEELDSSHTDPEYAITYMTMSYGEQVRPIIHYHYLVWPDFGVPGNPKSLVNFVRKVRSGLSYKGGPIVVHCSAGVGRTGTFITLDRLFQTMEEHDTVDIYGIVHEMRLNRPFMVQTEKQYIFIHVCLKYELEVKGLSNEAYVDGADDDDARQVSGGAGIDITVESASSSEKDDQSDDSTFQFCAFGTDAPSPLPDI